MTFPWEKQLSLQMLLEKTYLSEKNKLLEHFIFSTQIWKFTWMSAFQDNAILFWFTQCLYISTFQDNALLFFLTQCLCISAFQNWVFWWIQCLCISAFQNWVFWLIQCLCISAFWNWVFWLIQCLCISAFQDNALSFWLTQCLCIASGPYVVLSHIFFVYILCLFSFAIKNNNTLFYYPTYDILCTNSSLKYWNPYK